MKLSLLQRVAAASSFLPLLPRGVLLGGPDGGGPHGTSCGQQRSDGPSSPATTEPTAKPDASTRPAGGDSLAALVLKKVGTLSKPIARMTPLVGPADLVDVSTTMTDYVCQQNVQVFSPTMAVPASAATGHWDLSNNDSGRWLVAVEQGASSCGNRASTAFLYDLASPTPSANSRHRGHGGEPDGTTAVLNGLIHELSLDQKMILWQASSGSAWHVRTLATSVDVTVGAATNRGASFSDDSRWVDGLGASYPVTGGARRARTRSFRPFKRRAAPSISRHSPTAFSRLP